MWHRSRAPMGDVAGEWRLHVRAVFRSIVVAILALAGVVVIGVASTDTKPADTKDEAA